MFLELLQPRKPQTMSSYTCSKHSAFQRLKNREKIICNPSSSVNHLFTHMCQKGFSCSFFFFNILLGIINIQHHLLSTSKCPLEKCRTYEEEIPHSPPPPSRNPCSRSLFLFQSVYFFHLCSIVTVHNGILYDVFTHAHNIIWSISFSSTSLFLIKANHPFFIYIK